MNGPPAKALSVFQGSLTAVKWKQTAKWLNIIGCTNHSAKHSLSHRWHTGEQVYFLGFGCGDSSFDRSFCRTSASINNKKSPVATWTVWAPAQFLPAQYWFPGRGWPANIFRRGLLSCCCRVCPIALVSSVDRSSTIKTSRLSADSGVLSLMAIAQSRIFSASLYAGTITETLGNCAADPGEDLAEILSVRGAFLTYRRKFLV